MRSECDLQSMHKLLLKFGKLEVLGGGRTDNFKNHLEKQNIEFEVKVKKLQNIKRYEFSVTTTVGSEFNG